MNERLLTFAAAYGLINATGLLLVRGAMRSRESERLVSIATHPPIGLVAGLALYVVSFAAFIASTKYFPVTLVFPLLAGSAYALVVLGGWLFLGEEVSQVQVVGLVTVGIGMVLLQWR